MQHYVEGVRLGDGWTADIQYASERNGRCVILGYMAIRSPEEVSVIRCPGDGVPSVSPFKIWPNALLDDLYARVERWRLDGGQELCDEFWREQRRKCEEPACREDSTNDDSLDADFNDEDPGDDEA